MKHNFSSFKRVWVLVLICILHSACQKLNVNYNDLTLRCGPDAFLGDVERWVEVNTDLGRPNASAIEAFFIDQNLRIKKLQVSSRSCVGLEGDEGWLSIRILEAGAYGFVAEASEVSPRILARRVDPLGKDPECSLRSHVSNNELLEFSPLRYWENKTSYGLSEFVRVRLQKKGESSGLKEWVFTESSKMQLDLSQLLDGDYSYAIEFYRLLELTTDYQPLRKNCPLTIDRSAPQVRLGDRLLKDGQKIAPGEAIEILVGDPSPTKVLTCLQKEEDTSICRDFRDVGKKITAPEEGRWKISIVAEDQAGNKSPVLERSFAVLNSERVQAVESGLEEVRLLIERQEYLAALNKLLPLYSLNSRQWAQPESDSLEGRFLTTVLPLMGKDIPIQQLQFEEGQIYGVYPLRDKHFAVAYGAGFAESPLQILSLRTDGERIGTLELSENEKLAYNADEKELVVLGAGGSAKVYDVNFELLKETILEESPALALKTLDRISKGASVLFEGESRHRLLRLDDLQVLDLAPKEYKVHLSASGRWVLGFLGAQWMLVDVRSEKVEVGTLPFSVEDLLIAENGDYACFRGVAQIVCGTMEELFMAKGQSYGVAITRSYKFRSDLGVLAFASKDKLGLIDLKQKTLREYPFKVPIYQIFFNEKGELYVDSPKGRYLIFPSFSGFMDWDAEAPPLQSPHDQYWIAGSSVFAREQQGLVSYTLVQGQDLKPLVTLPLDSNPLDPRIAIWDRDEMDHFFVYNSKKLDVYPLKKKFSDNFQLPCQLLATDGGFCARQDQGRIVLTNLKKEGGDYLLEHSGVQKWDQFSWSKTNPSVFLAQTEKMLLVGEVSEKGVEILRAKKWDLRHTQWQWVREDLVAGFYVSDAGTRTKIYDFVRDKELFIQQEGDVDSLFEVPVVFAREISAFALVLRDESGVPHFELVDAESGQELARWVFDPAPQEGANSLRQSPDGKELLMALSDSSVQAVRVDDLRQRLWKPQPVGRHSDSVSMADYLGVDQAYSTSLGGISQLHERMDQEFRSRNIQSGLPTPDPTHDYWQGSTARYGWIWASDAQSFRVFTPQGRVLAQMNGYWGYVLKDKIVAVRSDGAAFAVSVRDPFWTVGLCEWVKVQARAKGERGGGECNF